MVCPSQAVRQRNCAKFPSPKGKTVRSVKTGWPFLLLLLLVLASSMINKLEILSAVSLVLVCVLFAQEEIVNFVKHFKKMKLPGFEFEPKESPPEIEYTKDTTKAPSAGGATDSFAEGNYFLQIEETLAAISKYEQAIETRPGFSDAYLNLGAAYLGLWHKTGREEHLHKSIEISKRALELSPGGYRSRINLAVAFSKIPEKEEEALKIFEEANRKGSDADRLTWAKVKLFKAKLILTLSERPGGDRYRERLGEARIDIRDCQVLLNLVPKHQTGEALQWIREAREVFDALEARRAGA